MHVICREVKPSDHVGFARLPERVVLHLVQQIVGRDLLVREASFVLLVPVREALPSRIRASGVGVLLEIHRACSEPVKFLDVDRRRWGVTLGFWFRPRPQAAEQFEVALPALILRLVRRFLPRLLLVLGPLAHDLVLPRLARLAQVLHQLLLVRIRREVDARLRDAINLVLHARPLGPVLLA